MTKTIKFNAFSRIPGGLLDVAGSTVLPLDNGAPGRASALVPVERACQMGASRRKVACAGWAGIYEAATDSTWRFRVARDAYSERVRIRIRCNLRGAASDDDFLTILAVSDTDAVGVEAVIHNDPEAVVTFNDAKAISLSLLYGDGTSAALGYDNVTITFTRSAAGTVHAYSITFQPLDMHEIEV